MTLYINGVEHLTIQEAAERCGRHHDTIKRRVKRRDFPNAFQGQDRNPAWLIPMNEPTGMGGIPVMDLVQRLGQKDVELAAARACANERLATITLLSGLISAGVR